MTATKVTSDRFKVSGLLAGRLKEHQVSVPAVLRRAGLPAGFFQQEKIYVTTAELFALWRAIGETSADPAIGLKLGAEPRFERYQPTAIAAVCSRSFRDALQRIARYKQITCPEEIRVRTSGDEASVEFIYLQAEEVQPDVMVDLVLSWILGIGRRGTDGQIAPLRLELTRSRSEPRVAGIPLRLPGAVQILAQRTRVSEQRPRPAVCHPERRVAQGDRRPVGG